MIGTCSRCGNHEWGKEINENIIKCPKCGNEWYFKRVPIMKWISIDEIDQYNIKPSFLKERLRDIIESNQTLHFISTVDRTGK